MLRERPFHEGGNVRDGVADRPEPVGHLQPLHEPGDAVREDLASVVGTPMRDVRPERFGRFEMTAGT